MTTQGIRTVSPPNHGEPSYGAVAQSFHWLTALLVFAQIVLGIQGALLPSGFEKLVILARHKSLGITLFVLTVLRLLWRARNRPPPFPRSMSRRESAAARASHVALYLLLVAMPLIGWLGSSASGISVSWFGFIALPDLLGPNKALARLLLGIHGIMAWLLIGIITVHIAAALWHHFLRRDTVLLRMWPGGHRGGPE